MSGANRGGHGVYNHALKAFIGESEPRTANLDYGRITAFDDAHEGAGEETKLTEPAGIFAVINAENPA